MDKTVRIERENHYNGRGVLRPFSWLYSLTYHGFAGPAVDYKGCTLATIRAHARRIASEHGARVVESWA